MNAFTTMREAFGIRAEHGLRNNVMLLGATVLIGAGIAAELDGPAFTFEALGTVAVAAPSAWRVGNIIGYRSNAGDTSL